MNAQYTVESLTEVASEFLRRADEAEQMAKQHPNSKHEARHDGEASAWRLAAAIVARTTIVLGNAQ